MNKCVLIGNIAADPILKTTSTGVAVCNFTIAVQRRFANANGEREVDFLPVIVWRAQAENCAKFLKKGSKAGVVGSIATRSYDDQNGNKRYVTEIVADEVEFLSSQPREQGNGLTEIDDDLPF